MYDNTKFNAAFDEWLKQNVKIGFGEHYAGDLLADFNEFIAETGMMKRSPGRVVFGRQLAEHGGFERRKVGGLTHWSGLTLKKPRATIPVRYASTIKRERTDRLDRKIIADREALRKSPSARAERLKNFQKELEEEDQKLRSLEDATM